MTRDTWAPEPEALPVAVIDNHCHLDFPLEGETGSPAITAESVTSRLESAARAGVKGVVQIGCDPESVRWTAAAVLEHPAMLGGVAVHPNEAARLSAVGDYDLAFLEVAAAARGERIRVIGETGLDFFRTGPGGGRDAQVVAFREHIALAKETGLALQIHDRDAHAEVLEVLDRDGAPERTVFHCFSGDAAFARECVARGYYLSFAGTVTFINAVPLREAVAVTPPSRILLETDSPFLTPHPHRGDANTPAQVARTAKAVAMCLNLELAELCEIVAVTSEDLYGPW